MSLRKTALASLMAAGASLPLTTLADSDFAVGAGAAAQAALDFEVNIPDFVYLRVGSLGVVDTVLFNLGTVAPGTGPGTVADVNIFVQLTSNAPGGVRLTASAFASATGPLAVSVPEISVANAGNITHPAFGDTTGTVLPGLVNETDTWTFSYANNGVYASGNYTDTITYTAQNL